MRRRVVRVLLLPLAALSFLMGWLLCSTTEYHTNTKRLVKKESSAESKTDSKYELLSEDEDVEVSPDLEA